MMALNNYVINQNNYFNNVSIDKVAGFNFLIG
jgi:hypothetical protein